MKRVITYCPKTLSLSNFNLTTNIRLKHALATVAIEIRNDGNDSSSESNSSGNALQVFDDLSQYDIVSATSLLGQFAKQSRHKDVLCLFKRFLELNIKPNQYTFGSVLPSATALKDICLGKQLQAYAIKLGLNSNVFAGSAILDAYVKMSNIEESQKAFDDIDNPNVVSYTTLMNGYLREEKFENAIKVFDRIPKRNVVSWNAVISGCSQSGKNEEAVKHFIHMLRDGVVPNHSTFPCAIIATANIAALGMGRSFHACALKYLGDLGVFTTNALVSFYAKCGEMEDSMLAFGKLSQKNVVSWNAIICGYAQNGDGREARNMFEKMQHSGIRPNDVTLLGLLLACNHCGFLDKGCSYFDHARIEYPHILKPEHYACVVDMLSRSGRFMEAQKFVADLPFDPGIGFWKAILGGCQIFMNMELGELAAGKIHELDPGDVSSYVMLSNAHSVAGRWQIVSTIRQEMKEKGMNRIPGCSWIEIKNSIHVFVNRDQIHAQKDQIYEVLRFFIWNEVQESQDINLWSINYFHKCCLS